MGEPYLVTLSPKTYLRLKRTNEAKLLHCHLCTVKFEMGDEVGFNMGSSRKRYHKSCALKVNFELRVPKDYEEKRKAILAEVEEWKETQKKTKAEEKKKK